MSTGPARALTVVAFLAINVTTQMLWICFAPVTKAAQDFYGRDELAIGTLAMLYMFIYVPASMPAAWAIDVFGFRKAVSFGALLLGVFSIGRAFVDSYAAAVACTVGLALSQPFLLNAFTKLAALWFTPKHRATMTGVAFLATFVGIAIGEALTPDLVVAHGVAGMQRIYAAAAAASALFFIVVAREPARSKHDDHNDDERALVVGGLSSMLRRRDMWLLSFSLFIANGVMNGVSTWVEGVVVERGIAATSAGDLAALMLIGGVVGAIVLPAISDRIQRRRPLLLTAFGLAVPSLAAVPLSSSFASLGAAFFCVGFCTIGAAPVAYQYGAEVTAPTPVGTSNGVFALVGQASVVFIFAMGAWKEHAGSWSPALWTGVGAIALSAFGLWFLPESPIANQGSAG